MGWAQRALRSAKPGEHRGSEAMQRPSRAALQLECLTQQRGAKVLKKMVGNSTKKKQKNNLSSEKNERLALRFLEADSQIKAGHESCF